MSEHIRYPFVRCLRYAVYVADGEMQLRDLLAQEQMSRKLFSKSQNYCAMSIRYLPTSNEVKNRKGNIVLIQS